MTELKVPGGNCQQISSSNIQFPSALIISRNYGALVKYAVQARDFRSGALNEPHVRRPRLIRPLHVYTRHGERTIGEKKTRKRELEKKVPRYDRRY